jgi:hypothetical protein
LQPQPEPPAADRYSPARVEFDHLGTYREVGFKQRYHRPSRFGNNTSQRLLNRNNFLFWYFRKNAG